LVFLEKQLFVSVQRGDLAAFCQGRVVEDRLKEAIAPAAEALGALSDMDYLGRACADGVHAQQPAAFAMEGHFQETRLRQSASRGRLHGSRTPRSAIHV
jgi:hypothetical protein